MQVRHALTRRDTIFHGEVRRNGIEQRGGNLKVSLRRQQDSQGVIRGKRLHASHAATARPDDEPAQA